MKTHLKFMELSLAAQARVMKRLLCKKRLPHPALQQEFQKARAVLKREARATHIAYGFLRGKRMTDIELPHRPYHEGHISCKGLTKTRPDWDMVEEIIKDNGLQYFSSPSEMLQRFAEFRDSAVPVNACEL